MGKVQILRKTGLFRLHQACRDLDQRALHELRRGHANMQRLLREQGLNPSHLTTRSLESRTTAAAATMPTAMQTVATSPCLVIGAYLLGSRFDTASNSYMAC
jgi:hypothetical protein